MKTKSLVYSFFAAALFGEALLQTANAVGDIIVIPDKLANQIEILNFEHGGNGCASSDSIVDAQIGSDKHSVSMTLDNYYADTNATHRSFDRKTCNLAMTVKVPHGLSISFNAMEIKGFVSVEDGAEARLKSEYFIAGTPSERIFTKIWKSGSHDINEVHPFLTESEIWSACGEDTIFRVNTSALVTEGDNGESANMNIGSLSFNSAVVLQLGWKLCN